MFLHKLQGIFARVRSIDMLKVEIYRNADCTPRKNRSRIRRIPASPVGDRRPTRDLVTFEHAISAKALGCEVNYFVASFSLSPLQMRFETDRSDVWRPLCTYRVIGVAK